MYDKKVKKGEFENEFTTIFRKNIRVTFMDGHILEGHCNTFTGKLDTEEELYDEITINTDKYPYVGFNESVIKDIEVI